jgi:hypothetical protein
MPVSSDTLKPQSISNRIIAASRRSTKVLALQASSSAANSSSLNTGTLGAPGLSTVIPASGSALMISSVTSHVTNLRMPLQRVRIVPSVSLRARKASSQARTLSRVRLSKSALRPSWASHCEK